jgi:hypothetical protein
MRRRIGLLIAVLAFPLAVNVRPAPVASAAQVPAHETGVLDDNWPPGALGGLMAPVRQIYDPFPTFDGLALDTENDRVIFSDENRH